MPKSISIPTDQDEATLTIGDRSVHLTDFQKLFWAHQRITKRDLLQYYLDVSKFLLPHLIDRPMVMKRYPNGADEEFFFMKRAPSSRLNGSRSVRSRTSGATLLTLSLVQDLPTLLWVVNFGCIDLNPWYGRCDDYDRPDFLHFDLDPGPGADFQRVCDVGMKLRDLLAELRMPTYPKTTGSKGFISMFRSSANPYKKRCGRSLKTLHRRWKLVIPSRDRRVSNREQTIRTGVGRLQSKCLGTHIGLHLFRSAKAVSHRVDARHVGRY